jgi:hypothetical protein
LEEPRLDAILPEPGGVFEVQEGGDVGIIKAAAADPLAEGDAVGEPQAVQEPAEVGADRGGAPAEGLGDLLVAPATGDPQGHGPLAGGEGRPGLPEADPPGLGPAPVGGVPGEGALEGGTEANAEEREGQGGEEDGAGTGLPGESEAGRIGIREEEEAVEGDPLLAEGVEEARAGAIGEGEVDEEGGGGLAADAAKGLRRGGGDPGHGESLRFSQGLEAEGPEGASAHHADRHGVPSARILSLS